MTSNLLRAALACAALVFAATAAVATVTPSQGTPIGLEHDPAGIVATGVTDTNGRVTFTDLKAGKYVLAIPPGLVPSDARHPHVLRFGLVGLHLGGARQALPVSFEVCTCAGGKQDTRIHVTVSDDGDSLQLDISDQGAAGGLISY